MSRRLQFWPGVVFALLGLNIALVAVTVYFAHRDGPIVAEPDYYQKAVEWDRSQELQRRSDALGWQVAAVIDGTAAGDAAGLLTVRFSDRDGQSLPELDVTVEVFHAAHAADREHLRMRDTDGTYTAPVRLRGPGRYEVRLRATGGKTEFLRSLVVTWSPKAGETAR